MRRIAMIVAAVISFTAVAQDVTVVGVGSVGTTITMKKKDGLNDSIREFDRKTKMLISEPEYECMYSYVINNPAKGDTVKEFTTCILQIGEGVGRFSDYTTFGCDSVRNIIGVDDYDIRAADRRDWQNLYAYDEIIYQNMPAGKMTVYSSIVPNYYVYEEDAHSIEWEIGEETDTICGYECMVAEGNYGGRTWRAWFTTEIPVAMGPWKISGLPGLVMKAADKDNLHVFEAISFRRGEVPIYRPNWPDAVKIDRNKFINNKKEFESYDDPMKHIPVESIKSVTVAKSASDAKDATLVVNGVPIRKKGNGYVARELE
ncbi:MAG: GLPGLI family protein [Muribaculaceae bacterium]|nr:GLPGLI family protein [Muribaculaceae bacterium]